MGHRLIIAAALAACLLSPAGASAAGNGLITVRSTHSVNVTIQRLETALRAKGMTIFARIDHARAATRVGQKLRPTLLLIFGNPKIGTALLKCKQTVGIDLPLKMLAWKDARGHVWLTYNDPRWIAERHHLGRCGATAVRTMSTALRRFAKAAAGR